jgi:hypothetical protein
MNDGLSEHHHAEAMKELKRFEKKLDELKHDMGMDRRHERLKETFRRVVHRLPAGDTPATTEETVEAAVPAADEQLGGS